jgi:uncharacterized membrane protein HdeD (DUF308 family)
LQGGEPSEWLLAPALSHYIDGAPRDHDRTKGVVSGSSRRRRLPTPTHHFLEGRRTVATASSFLLGGIEEIRRHWGWYLVLGVAQIVLGMLAIGPAVASLSLFSVIFLGWLMIIGGGLEAGHAFMRRAWSGFFVDLLIGLLYLVVGIMFITKPLLALETVTLFIAVMLTVGGAFRIVVALSSQFSNKGWMLLNGVITLVLGIMIWAQWPESSLWVVGLFIGIDLIFNGWSLVMLSLAARSVPAQTA